MINDHNTQLIGPKVPSTRLQNVVIFQTTTCVHIIIYLYTGRV